MPAFKMLRLGQLTVLLASCPNGVRDIPLGLPAFPPYRPRFALPAPRVDSYIEGSRTNTPRQVTTSYSALSNDCSYGHSFIEPTSSELISQKHALFEVLRTVSKSTYQCHTSSSIFPQASIILFFLRGDFLLIRRTYTFDEVLKAGIFCIYYLEVRECIDD